MENKKKALEQNINLSKEQWNRINSLIIKYKDGMKKRTELQDLDQPIMILLRRTQVAEIYEPSHQNKLSSSSFEFKHSNGELRKIDLKESYMYKIPYGQKTINAYFHHEDWAFPLITLNPITEFKAHKDSVQNAFSAEMKWSAEDKKASAKQIMAFAAVIGILVLGFILYIVLKPSTPAAVNIIQQGAGNISYTLLNAT